MGTKERRELEKQHRKEQILDAAKELFLAKTLGAVTIEDIAQKTELSVGTIYQYFRSKEDLFVSLNVSYLRRLRDIARKIANNASISPEEKIIKYKDAMYRTYKEDPVAMRAVIHVFLEDSAYTISQELLKEITDLGRETQGVVASIYEEGVRQGTFREGHGVAHADIIWAAFLGIMIWEETKRRINPKKNYFKPTLNTAFEILLTGMKTEYRPGCNSGESPPETVSKSNEVGSTKSEGKVSNIGKGKQ